MLSQKLAELSELVLREPRIKRGLRADLAAILADHAETAAAYEESGILIIPEKEAKPPRGGSWPVLVHGGPPPAVQSSGYWTVSRDYVRRDRP